MDWRQVLLGILIGSLIGALAGSWAQRSASHKFWKRGPNAERVAEKLAKKLDLDAAQRTAVKAIVASHHAKIMTMRHETDAKFDQARGAMHAEIRAILRPEQQLKLDEMRQRWDMRHKKRKERK